MRRFVFAAVLAAVAPIALAPPVIAQSYQDQRRWDDAQARYQAETNRFQTERQRYFAIRAADHGYRGPPPSDDRYDPNYDPSRYYRDGPGYQEHVLAADDRVYRGSDGRYYCKRSDGTTGLVVGAAAGGILGNVIDGGHSRTAGTLIGAALGALAGKSIEQNSDANIRCR